LRKISTKETKGNMEEETEKNKMEKKETKEDFFDEKLNKGTPKNFKPELTEQIQEWSKRANDKETQEILKKNQEKVKKLEGKIKTINDKTIFFKYLTIFYKIIIGNQKIDINKIIKGDIEKVKHECIRVATDASQTEFQAWIISGKKLNILSDLSKCLDE